MRHTPARLLTLLGVLLQASYVSGFELSPSYFCRRSEREDRAVKDARVRLHDF